MVRKKCILSPTGYPELFCGLAIAQQTMSQTAEEKCSSYPNLSFVGSQGRSIPIVKQLQLDLRRWLSPPDFSKNHNIARDVHYEGTASWFFQSEIFKEWTTTPSLLWIHGKRKFLPSVT